MSMRHRLSIGNVGPLELEVRERSQFRDAGFFQARIVIAIEIIDPDNAMHVGKQTRARCIRTKPAAPVTRIVSAKVFLFAFLVVVVYPTEQTVSLDTVFSGELRIGQFNPLAQRRARPPSYFEELRAVEQFARCPVGARYVEDELALVANDFGDQLGNIRDRHLIAAPDIEV